MLLNRETILRFSRTLSRKLFVFPVAIKDNFLLFSAFIKEMSIDQIDHNEGVVK